MKVVIAGGGTGGHLYPGISIARELLRMPGNEVLFVGTEQGIEARVLPKEGLPLRFITAGKLKGMGVASVLKTLITLPRSVYQSLRLLREARPDVALGVGGYASAPVMFSGWLLRVPTIIVEPNSYAGLANRMLAALVDRVVLCFPGTNRMNFFPGKKTVVTGPLARKGIDQGNREKALKDFGLAQGKFTVLVFGGSGGAHAINMAMKEAARLLADMQNLQVLHQTGDKDVEEVKAGYRDAKMRAAVFPYIYDMAGAYAAADLVVSRSGATTVAELAVCGKPAVLIPYPFAADNHQEYNARTLAGRGNADVIVQKDLTPDALAAAIGKHAGRGGKTAEPMESGAAAEIVRICTSYVQKD
jgi:UDP-N-acetylglucosamine--N-acetylmuramyl-(pentapeptide) pyrophosphoryl-undecaprenol N-acetylglucosamine transferase